MKEHVENPSLLLCVHVRVITECILKVTGGGGGGVCVCANSKEDCGCLVPERVFNFKLSSNGHKYKFIACLFVLSRFFFLFKSMSNYNCYSSQKNTSLV